jgi:hypothetical protein
MRFSAAVALFCLATPHLAEAAWQGAGSGDPLAWAQGIDADWIVDTTKAIDDVADTVGRLDASLQNGALFKIAQEVPLIGSVARVVVPDRIDRLRELIADNHRELMYTVDERFNRVEEKLDENKLLLMQRQEDDLNLAMLRLHKLLRERPPANQAAMDAYRKDLHTLLIDADTLLDARPRGIALAITLNVASVVLHQLFCLEAELSAGTAAKVDRTYYLQRTAALRDLVSRNAVCSRFMSLQTARSKFDEHAAELRRIAEAEKLDFLLESRASHPAYIKLTGAENAVDKTRQYLLFRTFEYTSDDFEAYYELKRPYAPEFAGIRMYHELDPADLKRVRFTPATTAASRELGRFGGSLDRYIEIATRNFNRAARQAQSAAYNYALVRSYNEWEKTSLNSLATLEETLSKERLSSR